jgi:hypothetical protein
MVPCRFLLLRSVVAALEQAGITALVFGGWAEELYGLIAARDHCDIDLLLVDPDDDALTAFLDGARRFSRSDQATSARSRSTASSSSSSSLAARTANKSRTSGTVSGGSGQRTSA